MLEIPKENKGHLKPSIKAPTMKDQDDKVNVMLFGLFKNFEIEISKNSEDYN